MEYAGYDDGSFNGVFTNLYTVTLSRFGSLEFISMISSESNGGPFQVYNNMMFNSGIMDCGSIAFFHYKYIYSQ
jgi:hypothetical protein